MYILHLHSYLSIKKINYIDSTHLLSYYWLSYSEQKFDKIVNKSHANEEINFLNYSYKDDLYNCSFFLQCELYMLHAETTIIL